MSAPSWGSTGTLLGASGASPAFAVPASVGALDVIVVGAYLDGSVTVTGMPTGFVHATGSPLSVAPGAGFGEHRIAVMWKRATGSDSGTYGFTLSSSAFVYGNAVRYTGCVTSGDPWDATATAQGGAVSLTTAPAVSLTTLGPDRLLFYLCTNHNGDGGTWTGPAGFTLRQGGTNQATHEIGDLAQSSAGGTGSLSGSTTASGFMGAFLGALIGTTGGAVEQNAAPPNLPPPHFILWMGARLQRMQEGTQGVLPTAVVGRAVLALAGTATVTKVAAVQGSSGIALTGRVTAAKVAKVAGVSVVALSAAGAAAKRAPVAGQSLLTLTGSVSESTATTRAQAGTTVLALRGSATVTRTATVAGRSVLALRGAATVARRAAQGGTTVVALSGTSTVRKSASVAGSVLLLLTGSVSESTGTARPVVGATVVALRGSATALRRALPSGSTVLALTGSASQRKTAGVTGRSVLTLAGTATVSRRASVTGRSVLLLLPYQIVPAPTNPPGAAFRTGADRQLLAMLGGERSGGPGSGRDRPTT